MADFMVTSSQFQDGGRMPMSAVHQWAGGQNISPDLSWSGAPSGAQSYAVTTYDPHAPTGVGFTHWILFNIPADVTHLEAGAGAAGKNPPGSVAGFTDFGGNEYGGSAPPPGHGDHHYEFTVYALDVPRLDLGPNTTYAMLKFSMIGHVLAEAKITALFGR